MLKCADCDEINPQWGSLNKGVLLCDECSSVHRHLGRHVSQIKHLAKSRWRKTQLTMLKTLAQSGSNKYWEHLLIEFSIRNSFKNNYTNEQSDLPIRFRKPTPKDLVHPTKNDFIKEKYLFFGFFKKPRIIVIDDLSQQLHACVRTGILEISLYLLTLGALPNYTHPNRHTTALHVAVMYNQPLQVELLLTYGADLLLVDGNGDTSLQIANKKSQTSGEPLKWQVLISCLLEAQFEITDTLSYYLCRQAIDHSLEDVNDPSRMVNNFLIPLLNTEPHSSHSKQTLERARDRLQMLPNDAFIDLCLDICDEIDRRETNDILAASTSTSSPPPPSSDKDLSLFFLPPNPNYSPTRNQGRQKLARLLLEEFRTLCYDVLVQASLRLTPQSLSDYSTATITYIHPAMTKQQSCSLPLGVSLDSCLAGEEDKNPVYDQVAGDGDYVYVMDLQRPHDSSLPNPICVQRNPPEFRPAINTILKNKRISMPLDMNSQKRPAVPDDGQYNNLLIKLDDLTGRNKLLQLWNNDLEGKVKSLQSEVCRLRDERVALLTALSSEMPRLQKVPSLTNRPRDYRGQDNESVYDLGSEGYSSGPWLRQEVVAAQTRNSAGLGNRLDLENQRLKATQPCVSIMNYAVSSDVPSQRIVYESKEDYLGQHTDEGNPFLHSNVSRTSTEVANGVETIILQIRILLDIANGRTPGDFLQCSKAIKLAVHRLVLLFAGIERRFTHNAHVSGQISSALRDLLAHSRDLRIRCDRSRAASLTRGALPGDRDTATVIHHAHEIARAAKQLLMYYQCEEDAC